MGIWAALPTDLLWRTALAAIPLALLVAVVARLLPCRPATRHTLWLVVLLWLVAAPFLPQAPRVLVLPPQLAERDRQTDASQMTASDPQLTASRSQSADVPVPPQEQSPVARWHKAQRGGAEPARAAPFARQEPQKPKSLAQAIGSGGPPDIYHRARFGATDPSPKRKRGVYPHRSLALAAREDGA